MQKIKNWPLEKKSMKTEIILHFYITEYIKEVYLAVILVKT